MDFLCDWDVGKVQDILVNNSVIKSVRVFQQTVKSRMEPILTIWKFWRGRDYPRKWNEPRSSSFILRYYFRTFVRPISSPPGARVKNHQQLSLMKMLFIWENFYIRYHFCLFMENGIKPDYYFLCMRKMGWILSDRSFLIFSVSFYY